jgi:FKBP-type peptidyl-prolyl cis-trans isomerase FkpA
MRQLSLFLAIACLSVLSCKKDVSPEEQLQIDIQKIKDYLTANNLTATETASGLHYIITQEGTGNNPTLSSNVTVKYKGYLLDGMVFDQTSGSTTATFPLANLIEAWQEGIPLLKKGGKGTFLSPSALAYGPNGVPGIPGNSVLIFEIELVNF